MAKVLLINGSPREHGNTFTALNEVAKTLNEEGVETKWVTASSRSQAFLVVRRLSLKLNC